MSSLDERFPALTTWTQDHGWIEVGLIEGFEARIQVLDGGGLIWSGASSYPSLDAAFQAAEQAIAQWLEEQFPVARSSSRPIVTCATRWGNG